MADDAKKKQHHRTRICGFIQDGQKCPNRDTTCTFAHCEEELKRSPFLKTKLCPKMPLCNADNCTYAHDVSELRSVQRRGKKSVSQDSISHSQQQQLMLLHSSQQQPRPLDASASGQVMPQLNAPMFSHTVSGGTSYNPNLAFMPGQHHMMQPPVFTTTHSVVPGGGIALDAFPPGVQVAPAWPQWQLQHPQPQQPWSPNQVSVQYQPQPAMVPNQQGFLGAPTHTSNTSAPQGYAQNSHGNIFVVTLPPDS